MMRGGAGAEAPAQGAAEEGKAPSLGDEERLPGERGREQCLVRQGEGEDPQALQPWLRGDCPVVGRMAGGREPCPSNKPNVGESPGCAEEGAEGGAACAGHRPPRTGGKGGGGEEQSKLMVHRSSPRIGNHGLL